MIFAGAKMLGSNEKAQLSSAIDINFYKESPLPKQEEKTDTIITLEPTITNDHIAVTATAQRYDVVYTRADGNQFRRSGGTRAWRNMNPGNIRYSDFARQAGAIGHAGGFAVFPDEETGMKAIGALLKSDKYRNLTISQAIFKYAPPHENDTEKYKASLRKMTGLPITKKIFELDDEQMMCVVKAIRVVEGWREGKETFIQAQPTQTDSLTFYANAQKRALASRQQKTI